MIRETHLYELHKYSYQLTMATKQYAYASQMLANANDNARTTPKLLEELEIQEATIRKCVQKIHELRIQLGGVRN